MSFLASYARYVQTKLGYYDKQIGEHSLEQRILEGIECDDVRDQRTFLIDVDVVRGSVFAKNKPRHGWTQAVFWGTLRSAFAPFYWSYWSSNLSYRSAIYVLVHFVLQFLQVVCFLLIDPDTTRSSQDDVIVPFMLAIGLGILHTHITSAHGGLTMSSQTGDVESRMLTTMPESIDSSVNFMGFGIRRQSHDSVTTRTRRRRFDDVHPPQYKTEKSGESVETCVSHFANLGNSDASRRVVYTSGSGHATENHEMTADVLPISSEVKSMISQTTHSNLTYTKSARHTVNPFPKRTSIALSKTEKSTDSSRPSKRNSRLLKNFLSANRELSLDESSSDVPRPRAKFQRKSPESLGFKLPENKFAMPKCTTTTDDHFSISESDDTGRRLKPVPALYSSASTQIPLSNSARMVHKRCYSIHFPVKSLLFDRCWLPFARKHHLRRSNQLWHSCSNIHEFPALPSIDESGISKRASVNKMLYPHDLPRSHSSIIHSGASTSSATSNRQSTTVRIDPTQGYDSVQDLEVEDPTLPKVGFALPSTPLDTDSTFLKVPSNNKYAQSKVTQNDFSVSNSNDKSVRVVITNTTAGQLSHNTIRAHRESDYPETEEESVSPFGSMHPQRRSFPSDDAKSEILKQQFARVSTTSTVLTQSWSPESDTELDAIGNHTYGVTRTRRMADYSNVTGHQGTHNYRTCSSNPRFDSRNGGRITSETECDRIGSDVGSDVDSSSGPDNVEPLPGQSAVTCLMDAHVPRRSSKELRPPGKPQRISKRIRRISGRFVSRQPGKPLVTETTAELELTDSTDSEPRQDDAWAEQEGVTDSERSDGDNHIQQPDISLSNAEDASRPVKLDFPKNWTGDDKRNHVTAGRPPTPVKLLHKPSDSFPKSLTSQPSSLTETVRCYVWEGDSNSKINLTVFDIGYNVIRAVERQGISADYLILAFLITLLLPLLSVAFHWTNIIPQANLTAVGNNQTNAVTLPQFSLIPDDQLSLPVPLGPFADSLLVMHFRVLMRIGTKLTRLFTHPFHWLCARVSFDSAALHSRFWYLIGGQWMVDLLQTPDLAGILVIFLGFVLRLNVYGAILFLLCIAEMTFQQRLLYAKYFFSLTSARRARKYRVPQFRLNKLSHIKCWLTLRSYLKKRGPQRSVETVIAAAFYIVFFFGLGLCSQLISGKDGRVFSHLTNWDILGLTLAIMLFLHRLIILGTKITKKYRNFSILITEQINLYLSMEKKPEKKEELMATFQVLRLVEGLLKEVDGPFRVCGWTVNPLVYNIFKLVLLSCFSSLLSEMLGFKLKLYKLKLNAANW